MDDLDIDLNMEVVTEPVKVALPEISTPDFEAIKPGEKAKNVNAIIIDTVNELQDNEYLENMRKQGKASFQQYIDLNVKLKVMVNDLKDLFDEVVLVIGGEGTGKSFGIKGLDPRRSIWFNTDRKPATFKGGRKNYKKEYRNYFDDIKSYPELLDLLTKAKKICSEEEPVIVFLLGHLAKDPDTGAMKLKTIGKFGEKLNIVGSVTNCYFTHLVPGPEGKMQYLLDTTNDGTNVARCLEDLYPTKYIPNNFEYIRQSIADY